MCIFRKRVKRLLRDPGKPLEKLQILSKIAKDLQEGEWVQILNEFETVPQFLLDCLKPKKDNLLDLFKSKKDKAEKMTIVMTIVEDLLDLARGADFKFKKEINTQLDDNRKNE